jgi:dCTP deaminase
MSFLPHDEILSRQSELFLAHFCHKYVKQASYDLRLGEEVYIMGQRAPERLTDRNPFVSIPPGQFALLTTHEEVRIPDSILAFITLRFSFKLQGLVNVSGFHVDPTYQGKLLFSVQNVGPSDIRLKYGEPTFSIFFATLTSSGIGESRGKEQAEFKRLKGIRLQDVQSLGGNNLTLARVQKDLDRLRTLVLIYGPFAVAATIALFAILIKLFFSKSP